MASDPIAMVKTILSTTPERWLSLMETLSPDLLNRPPAPGEWSAVECLYHLLDTEAIFPVRLRALLTGQPIVAFDPDAEGTKNSDQSAVQLAQKFADMRRANLEEIDLVTVQDLLRTGEHSELGTVTLGELLHEWAAHDLTHTVQAERALMQPFIAGSGPWRSYFRDHDVSR
jgi:uncharacterized damage-inducible protein DinB